MTSSEVTKFLENAFDLLNEEFFEEKLPKVIITIVDSKRSFGHFTPWKPWRDGGNEFAEINISSCYLTRPIENVIATLQHEAVHCWNYYVAHQKDTSRNNQYHNKIFKREAEARGLIISYDPIIGFSVTQPGPELISFIREQGWQNISLARTGDMNVGAAGGDQGSGDNGATKRKSGVRKYVCGKCGISVRATRDVKIGCLTCGCEMLLEEKGA